MTAGLILLADAIVSVINTDETADAFVPLTFTAKRSYPDWDDDFSDLKTLSVDVVFVSSAGGGGVLAELDSEGSIQTDQGIDIAVRYRFDPSEREADGRLKKNVVDKYVNLVEAIHEHLAGDRMQALTLAVGCSVNWTDTSVRTYCDYARLRQGIFLGVVRVRYDISKAG